MPPKTKRKGGKPGEESPSLPQISESEPLPTEALASLSLDDNKKKSEAKNEARADDFSIELSPMWSGSTKGWSLTWGIWHRLPREEQKKIALQHGLKSIGEFEEFVSLQQAVDDSEYSMVEADAEPTRRTTTTTISTETAEPDNLKDDNDEEEVEEEEDEDDTALLEETSNPENTTEQLSAEELMKVGGQILLLPSEILHQIFAWLPVDSYGTLALVSPHWKYFTRTEAVYKRLCERLYLNQSKRRQLHVSRFGGSYRTMLETRPRVRAAGGCYVLKYSKIKRIERDMWCEIPVGAILETVYYRYLYFHEDGRCLYALSNSPPKIMFPRIRNVILHKEEHDVSIVSGWFQVQKYNCTVIAKQQWQSVKFEISILPESQYGNFSELCIDRHVTSGSGDFDEWSYDFHEHKVPDKNFRFIKDARL
uniref:F-box domain-containing protein n=1 Tax=Pseudo-nitzschia arenysensis TaxID=697910 RepID=A0A7S0F7H7_9STRA|mmetsp:Transcript_739/g.1756  ORF Transcript_739/g.1756 Transcript_739/m.1756 type:complete len:423 (+) Transcript_739:71-1339(+)